MGGLLLGFALGAMAFTAQGREVGNMVGSTAISAAKKMMRNAKNESAKQSSRAARDDSTDR